MKVREYTRGKVTYIEPVDNQYLFVHCANGEVQVSKRIFKESVEPLLLVHDIRQIEYVE